MRNGRFVGLVPYRVQLTSDGLRFYTVAGEESRGSAVDYAQLIKHYGQDPTKRGRYSPPVITGTERICCKGNPDPDHAVALHFMYYNFGRIHKTLRVTPAMAAGVSDHVWLGRDCRAVLT
jgi:hypothetical protein